MKRNFWDSLIIGLLLAVMTIVGFEILIWVASFGMMTIVGMELFWYFIGTWAAMTLWMFLMPDLVDAIME